MLTCPGLIILYPWLTIEHIKIQGQILKTW